MLYHKENADLDKCNMCGMSRWQQKKRSSVSRSGNHNEVDKIPGKVLRYFPPTKRLQRFYAKEHIAKSMRWHAEDRVDDVKLRHPGDVEAWKNLDHIFSIFGQESRNVKLGLSSDGFNPFSINSSGWFTWPVILMLYNMPPWMCMKQPYTILSLLIPRKYYPGNDIYVYLEPLIDELKQLWEVGAATFDAYGEKIFDMHACVLWKLNDFPAYDNLFGWATKG